MEELRQLGIRDFSKVAQDKKTCKKVCFAIIGVNNF